MYLLESMTQGDVAEVSRVERRCFDNPWPTSAYRRELQNPAQNFYVVLRETPDYLVTETVGDQQANAYPGGAASVRALPRRSLLPIGIGRRQDENGSERDPIIGFGGMWLAFDEAHITTIGVDPPRRGRGLGELLLLCMVDEAIARGANWLTLEVRVSNLAAQTLYRKYGFSTQGTRKRYYSDNNEDALIMWSRALREPDVRASIEERRRALASRLGDQVAETPLSPLHKTGDVGHGAATPGPNGSTPGLSQ